LKNPEVEPGALDQLDEDGVFHNVGAFPSNELVNPLKRPLPVIILNASIPLAELLPVIGSKKLGGMPFNPKHLLKILLILMKFCLVITFGVGGKNSFGNSFILMQP
jgi:hypothetical protein